MITGRYNERQNKNVYLKTPPHVLYTHIHSILLSAKTYTNTKRGSFHHVLGRDTTSSLRDSVSGIPQ